MKRYLTLQEIFDLIERTYAAMAPDLSSSEAGIARRMCGVLTKEVQDASGLTEVLERDKQQGNQS